MLLNFKVPSGLTVRGRRSGNRRPRQELTVVSFRVPRVEVEANR